ncbi:hypothetical protein DLAC_04990 [Tieghemostelium lacteum]|uniref:Uncharacterized protein n=1 Tax=Tieghemostelium lacteum TaxID=361077 RepID=A0A151ZHZ8_TIELA|nr:hypothetical protein DLAC_04990 [Tieghemostelium lacteum]|eukprot:KYQ93612.1 hypothetical protein DLAC_04990 [Tieghemostelium lacteum]
MKLILRYIIIGFLIFIYNFQFGYSLQFKMSGTSTTNSNQYSQNIQELKLQWDSSKVIDKTQFSKSDNPGLSLSNNDQTVTREERFRGDDFPPIRILSKSGLTDCGIQGNISMDWSVRVDESHGFLEVGLYNTKSNQCYLYKSSGSQVQFENIQQDESSLDYQTSDFGEAFSNGDYITTRVEFIFPSAHSDQNIPYLNIHYLKNGRYLGSPFQQISPIYNFYPMVGLNDNGDQVTLIFNP